MSIERKLIEMLPKTDLHVHLDGSLRLNTILELATEQDIHLPATDPEKLKEIVTCERGCKDLEEYLQAFAVTLSVLQTEAALRRAARELLEDAAAEHIRYLEVRYAPMLHTGKGLSPEQVIEAVTSGLQQGEAEFGVKWGVIACAIRNQPPANSLKLAEIAVAYRNRGVVAFDLAGGEYGHPAIEHLAAFQYCRDHNFNLTIHAGEATGAESIHQALHRCGAHRIGHGTRLYEDHDLLNYVNDHRICLEVCLTSNCDTRAVPEIAAHPFREYLEKGLQVTLNTDNRLVSNTTLTDEYMKAIEAFDLSFKQVKRIILNGFNNAFLPYESKVRLIEEIKKELNISDL